MLVCMQVLLTENGGFVCRNMHITFEFIQFFTLCRHCACLYVTPSILIIFEESALLSTDAFEQWKILKVCHFPRKHMLTKPQA